MYMHVSAKTIEIIYVLWRCRWLVWEISIVRWKIVSLRREYEKLFWSKTERGKIIQNTEADLILIARFGNKKYQDKSSQTKRTYGVYAFGEQCLTNECRCNDCTAKFGKSTSFRKSFDEHLRIITITYWFTAGIWRKRIEIIFSMSPSGRDNTALSSFGRRNVLLFCFSRSPSLSLSNSLSLPTPNIFRFICSLFIYSDLKQL